MDAAATSRSASRCGKGTYVRALAEDIGAALGCGAHLAALRRTASGGFDIGDAVSLEALEAMDDAARDARLLPVDALLASLPRLDLDAGGRLALRAAARRSPAAICADGDCRALTAGGRLRRRRCGASTGALRPRRLLATGDAGSAPLILLELYIALES